MHHSLQLSSLSPCIVLLLHSPPPLTSLTLSTGRWGWAAQCLRMYVGSTVHTVLLVIKIWGWRKDFSSVCWLVYQNNIMYWLCSVKDGGYLKEMRVEGLWRSLRELMKENISTFSSWEQVGSSLASLRQGGNSWRSLVVGHELYVVVGVICLLLKVFENIKN